MTVSKDTISRIVDKVTAEMTEWANRPLDRVYPVIFIDALGTSNAVGCMSWLKDFDLNFNALLTCFLLSKITFQYLQL